MPLQRAPSLMCVAVCEIRARYLGFTSFLAVISIVYMEGVLIRRMYASRVPAPAPAPTPTWQACRGGGCNLVCMPRCGSLQAQRWHCAIREVDLGQWHLQGHSAHLFRAAMVRSPACALLGMSLPMCECSHLVLIPQYAALRHGTVGKMDWVNVACMAICLAIYIPSGLAGYMQLGDSTPDDVSP